MDLGIPGFTNTWESGVNKWIGDRGMARGTGKTSETLQAEQWSSCFYVVDHRA